MVQLLVQHYDADVTDCAVHSDDFAVVSSLPLYAAAQAGQDLLHILQTYFTCTSHIQVHTMTGRSGILS